MTLTAVTLGKNSVLTLLMIKMDRETVDLPLNFAVKNLLMEKATVPESTIVSLKEYLMVEYAVIKVSSGVL